MAALVVGLFLSLGGALLTALFTPKPRDQYGSRLSDINVTPVSPGNPIVRVWGTMKVPAQIIFCSPLIETMHTHQASKKGQGKGGIFGGNQAKSYTFTYSVDVAFSVCAGPVYQVNRIWANQKLLYVAPNVAAHAQADFDAAYQSEATRLIDEEGVDLDYAAASAFVFAFNNFDTAEVTLSSPSDAVTYILAHPIDDRLGITGMILTPDSDGVSQVIGQLYSGLNNQDEYEANINRFDMLEIYQGDESQIPNSLMEGYLGSGNAPAFRGCCYFVLTNLQLMDFGNSVPTMMVEVQANPVGTTSLPEILTAICYEAGLVDGQFSLMNVDATPFGGFCVTQAVSARQLLQDLQQAFPFDSAETGYQIIFSMINKQAVAIVRREDLAAHIDTEEIPDAEEITRLDDFDLPYRLNFSYQEPARNYSKNTLYAVRYNTNSLAVENVDVTVAMDRQVAQQQAYILLANKMTERRTYKYRFPPRYVGIDPSDVIRIVTKGETRESGYYEELYCTQVQIGANGIIEMNLREHYYIDPSMNPSLTVGEDSGFVTLNNDKLPTTSATMSFLYDCPLLFDTDTDGPGFYTLLAGAFNGWQGGALYVDTAESSIATAYGFDTVTTAAGSNWQSVGSSSINIPWGTALDALASGIVSCVWDRVSIIHVFINNGMQLQSADETDMLTQALNVTFIGGELCQYSTAENLGNNLWRLSGFLRGLRTTERLMDSHVQGENFVRLSSNIVRVPTTKADLNIANSFVAATFQMLASTQVPFDFTDTGVSLKPPTVFVYRRFRDVDGDIEVDWYPRVRQNGGWISGGDVAIAANDLPETYSVDVLSSDKSTVVATYSITGDLGGAFVYTSAQQTIDFGSAQTTLNVVIYMISNVVGRGFPIGITL